MKITCNTFRYIPYSIDFNTYHKHYSIKKNCNCIAKDSLDFRQIICALNHSWFVFPPLHWFDVTSLFIRLDSSLVGLCITRIPPWILNDYRNLPIKSRPCLCHWFMHAHLDFGAASVTQFSTRQAQMLLTLNVLDVCDIFIFRKIYIWENFWVETYVLWAEQQQKENLLNLSENQVWPIFFCLRVSVCCL